MEKVKFTDYGYLKLALKSPDFTRNYGVLYRYKIAQKEHTVKFNLKVSYIKTIIDRARIFRLERTTPVFINDKEPDLIADQLASECGAIFYPLLIEVDFDGKFMAVQNHREIVDRWNKKKEAIGEYFQGEMAERYIHLMNEAIATPEQVTRIFENELFISVYFASFYRSYSTELKLEEKLLFPVAGKTGPVEFLVTEELNGFLNNAGNIELHHTGIMTDERSVQDLREERRYPIERIINTEVPAAKGNYYGRYVFEPETMSLRSAVAKWKLELEDLHETEIKIFELLEEKDAGLIKEEEQDQGNQGLVFIDGNAEKKDKKFTDLFDFLWK